MRRRSKKDLKRITVRLAGLPRPIKRIVMVGGDVVAIAAALWLAFTLKHDSLTHGFSRNPWLYFGAVVACVLAFQALGLYRSVVRYLGVKVVISIFAGIVVSATVLYVLGQTIAWRPVQLSLVVVYALIALTSTAGGRFVARWLLLQRASVVESVAIYGAGEVGARLAQALVGGSGLAVVAFIDDKSTLQGSLINGVPVWSPHRLPQLIERLDITRVLLAVPSASRKRRAEIIRNVEGLGLRIQTMPDLTDIASDRARVDELREIDVADLLGRDPVPPNERLLDACIRDKSVMVTGAGGSIGSELCRQILRLGVRRLVLLELSEVALYEVERELRATIAEERLEVELVALLGNVHHRYRARNVMQAFGVQTVYHAAAYKHVPIVEQNVIDGIHNNVIGTWYTAEAALECGVETFVLISTDKAVSPTNVMGATKRLAELVLQALHHGGARTRFCMVRFGNVLESSGSVVPLFRRQIRGGGPVTVTHPEVIRYFMTIPEASQLVLQAGAMAQGGDVFVLDMGNPVRIHDLARRMIDLSGLTVRDEQNPDGDIEIQITGLRPAEKLYEELLIGTDVTGTEHPRIMRAMEHSLNWEQMHALLQNLLVVMDQFDVAAARSLLLSGVHEYDPAAELIDVVWRRRQQEAEGGAKVANLDARRAVTKRDVGSVGS